MYTLTLTQAERKALDWIGGRYAHGFDLMDILILDCEKEGSSYDKDGENWWNEGGDTTFRIPEHAAWRIAEMVDSPDFPACLADEFASKLYAFRDRIV